MSPTMNLSGARLQKSLLIVLVSFLTAAIIIAWMNPATGFESSIYSTTPLVLWIALIFSEIVGVSLVIRTFSSRDPTRNTTWKYGLLLIFLVYAVTLSLFIIRGYYMWCMGGDPATHLGWANEILQTGHLPSNLIYPATHIFLSEISMVTSLSPVSLHRIVPFFFGLICVAFTYLFVRELSPNTVMPIIAAVISCPFVYSLYLNLTPNELANMLIPLALFLIFKYLRRNNAGWGILLVVILILYPIFHPLPAIVLGIILLTLWIPPAFRDAWNNFRLKKVTLGEIIRRNFDGNVVIPFLVLAIWFIFWYSSFSLWGSTLSQMYQVISSEGGPSQMTGLAAQINYAQGYGYNVAEIFLKQYGGPFLVGLLSIVAFPLLWKRDSEEQKMENIFSIYGPWFLLCLFIPVLFLFNLPFGPLRFVAYSSILGTVFVAFLISFLLIKSRGITGWLLPLVISVISIVLICILFLNGTLTLYPSPYSFIQNYQTTHAEVSGMANFFDYRDVSVNTTVITSAPRRFADLLLTPKERGRQHLPYDFDDPPWHFGYNEYPSLASSFTTKSNMIITQRDKVVYTDYFPNMAKIRFVPGDFERLKNDPGVDYIYSNGEFDLMTINPREQGVAD
jgi:hypothetical protein